MERSTRDSITEPSSPITIPRMITPSVPAARASSGYTGFTSTSLMGGFTAPPTLSRRLAAPLVALSGRFDGDEPSCFTPLRGDSVDERDTAAVLSVSSGVALASGTRLGVAAGRMSRRPPWLIPPTELVVADGAD